MQNTMNQDETIRKNGRGNKFFQYFAAIVVSLTMVETGTSTGWTSPALSYLRSNQSHITISKDEASQIASLNALGSIAGCILSSLLVNQIGRKYIIILIGLSQLIGWTVVNFSETSFDLFVAKFLMGSGGASFSMTVIYVGEISSARNRGSLLSLLPLSYFTGYAGMTAIGTFFPYHTMNKLGLIIPLISIILSLLIPETPYFSLMKNQDMKAERTLMKLEGIKDPVEVKLDLERMKLAVLESQKMRGFAVKELLSTGGNRRAFIILIAMVVTRQLSGAGAIMAFTQEIFENSGSIIGAKYSALIFAVSKLVAVLFTNRTIDLMGRRRTFLFSGLLIALSLTILGIHFFLKKYLEFDMASFLWLPLATLMFYAFTYAFGFGSVPSVVGGEIFPVNVKGVAVSTAQIMELIMMFIVTRGFYTLEENFEDYGTYWIFATFAVIGSSFIFWYTPETRGRNLEEILEMMSRRKTFEE